MAKVPQSNYDRASLCYATAYFAIPHYVFKEPQKVLDDFAKDPGFRAKFFYAVACKMDDSERHEEDVRAITANSVALSNGFNAYIIGYPKFPAPDLSSVPENELVRAIRNVVLAPYFSAIVFRGSDKIDHYYVLGQSPMGGTTFREVRGTANMNLGGGCDPTLSAFTEFLRDKLLAEAQTPQPVAGFDQPRVRRRGGGGSGPISRPTLVAHGTRSSAAWCRSDA